MNALALRPTVTLTVLVSFIGIASAQDPADLTGLWTIEATVRPQQEPTTRGVTGPPPMECVFQGTANLAQNGSAFSGDVDVGLSGGAFPCPNAMSGNMNGETTDTTVEMGMIMRTDGDADPGGEDASFTGNVDASVVSTRGPAVMPPSALSGTVTITSGPFAGASGPWTARRLVTPTSDVPVLSNPGNALLIVLLVVFGALLVFRQSRRK